MFIYESIQYLLLFILGASLASFYNATIYRLEKETPFPEIITKGSSCEKCGKILKWYELIPVLGYFLIKGKCGKCGYKVSAFYPISEALFGLSFILLFYYGATLPYFLLVNMLFFLALYDYEYKGFPRAIMHIFLLISGAVFAYTFFFTYNNEWVVLVVSVSIALAILVLNLFKQSFGTGDLLVILMISFIVTLSQFVSIIFFSIVLAGVFSIVVLLFKKVSKKDAIPFVPFLYLAFLLIFPLQHYIAGYFASLIQLW